MTELTCCALMRKTIAVVLLICWERIFGAEVRNRSAVCGFCFAFGKMGIRSIVADHMSENTASGRVMQKASMYNTGQELSKYEKCGKLYDADGYKITQEDWKSLPHKYMVVLTNAYSQGNIKSYFRSGRENRKNSFREHVFDMYDIILENIIICYIRCTV